MRTFLITILTLLMFSANDSLAGEPSLSSEKHGPFVFGLSFENGQLHSELNLKEGLPQGPSKEYYENGTLKKESNLTGEPFELSGKTIIYFENGKVNTEITTFKGKLVYSISYDLEGRVTGEDSEGKSISYWYENNGKRHVVINGVPQD